MSIDRLIDHLVQDLRPAPPLRGPWVRAGWWLFGAAAYLGALTLLMTSRADLAANGTGWRFVFPQIAAIVMAAASATAAFALTEPGVSRRILLLPAATAMMWLAGLVVGAVQEWSLVGSAPVIASREWPCVVMIVVGGALPGLGLAVMLRQGAPLSPRLTAMLGVLAVAGLANVVACVSDPHPSNAVTLVWHGGTILALVALAALGSRLVLTWKRRHP